MPADDGGPTRYETIMQAGHAWPVDLGERFAGASRAARAAVTAAPGHEAAIRDVAAGVAAPGLVAFALWLLEESERRGLRHLRFLSRDGQVLHELTRRLAAATGSRLDLEYVYSSRLTWSLAATDPRSLAQTAWLYNSFIHSNAADVCSRLGLPFADFRQVMLDCGVSLDPDARADQPAQADALRRFAATSEVVEAAGARIIMMRRLVLDYSAQHQLADSGTGLVDIGWTGRMAGAFIELCEAAGMSRAGALLKAFAGWFGSLPDLNLAAAGITGPYAISFVIGSVVAALLIFGQVIRTLWTRDGTGIAQALAGTVKTVLAWLLTGTVATAALAASDQVARFIVTAEFGSQAGFARKPGAVVNWSGMGNPSQQAATAAALLLVIGLIGILLIVVLWFELLLRNAAIAILIATSPVAAAGQVSDATKAWWSRTVSATVQLIILKPVIALVFAVGFGMAGQSAGVTGILQGLLVLGLAAFAWPVIARFFTFATIQAADSGLGALLGLATGAIASRAGGGGTAGVPPDQLGRDTEARVMGGGGSPVGEAAGGGGGGAALGGIGSRCRQRPSSLAPRVTM
jgi:hypothetical protein